MPLSDGLLRMSFCFEQNKVISDTVCNCVVSQQDYHHICSGHDAVLIKMF